MQNLFLKKSSACNNSNAMYEYAKIVFIEDPEKALQLFRSSCDDDDHIKSKYILSTYNILKDISGFTEIPNEAQIFITKNFGKINFEESCEQKK